MLKIVTLIVILFLNSLIADARLSQFESKLQKIDKNYLTIADKNSVIIGASGIVLHSFDAEHKTIIAKVEVVEKKDGLAFLKYKSFDGLKQSALPDYTIVPKEGDTVVLNYLYDRAMAIVPNAQTLKEVTMKYDNFEWIEPDIFASTLAIEYTPVPKKDDFQKECTQDDFALLFFAIENDGYFVDCNSFKIISQTTLNTTEQKTKVPFYNRLKSIKGRVFGLMGGDGIKDYSRYYKQLLGL